MDSVDIQFKRWQRLLNKAINVCFKKRRINQDAVKKATDMDELIDKRKKLLKKNNLSVEDETIIEEIEDRISKGNM